MFDLLPRPRRIAWLVVLVLVPIVGCWDKNDPPSAAPPPAPADLDKQLNTICSHCHAYPPADTFPRSAWKEEVEQAYRFAADAKMPTALPPIDSVIKYFEEPRSRTAASRRLREVRHPAACHAPAQAPALSCH